MAISLDARITAQAVESIMNDAEANARWMLHIDQADRGKAHSWTDQYGHLNEQEIHTQVLETTAMVNARRLQIEAAVEANRG